MRRVKILSISILFITIFLNFSQVNAERLLNSQRINGQNRYETAVETSKKGWTTSENAILAYGRNFPDALSGAPLAYALDAPILLTERDSVPQITLDEINRLGAKNVYILGGSGVISDNLINELEAKGLNIQRISGNNRFKTSIEVAKKLRESKTSSTVVLTYAYNYPDALGIGPVAATKGWPILFTDTTTLNEDTKNALRDWGITDVLIVGGEGVISKVVENEVKILGINVERVWGNNREETALNVVQKYYNNPEGVIISTGYNFPDALAGGPLAGKLNYPILLVKPDEVKEEVINYIKNSGAAKVIILGGESAVTDSVISSITWAFNGTGNTSANINNLGYIVENNGWLYYSDSGNGLCITKSRIDGSDKQRLNRSESWYLNIAKNYLYYTKDFDNKIYRMKLDGTENKCINNTDWPKGIIINGNYIYYINFTDNRKIYRMKLDGSERQVLINDEYCQYINVTDEYIYYTSGGVWNGGAPLYRVDKNGKNKSLICNEECASVIVYKDAIYFSNTKHDYNFLYKINTDGSNLKKLNSNQSVHLNIKNDTIYYTNISDESKIYSIKTDGTMQTKVSNTPAFYMNIIGDYIYYSTNYDYLKQVQKTEIPEQQLITPIDEDILGNLSANISNGGFTTFDGNYLFVKSKKDGYIYRSNIDQADKILVVNNSFAKEINVVGDWIYYVDNTTYNKKGIWKEQKDGTGDRSLVILKPNVNYMLVKGEWIYFTSNLNSSSYDSGPIYKVKTDGTGETVLSWDNACYLNILGDWVYYSNVDDNNSIYKIKVDGTNKTKILNEYTNYLNVYNNDIYFKSNNEIKKINIDGTNISGLGINGKNIIVAYDKIYFYNLFKIYQCNLDGTDKMFLTNCSYDPINVTGDYLYFHEDTPNQYIQSIKIR